MSERAVSEVVSYVLVFGLVVSAVGIVSVSGLSTLQDVRANEQMANAERAFDVLADNLADIHRRDAPSRATEISLGEAKLETGDNVTITVSVESGGTWNNKSWQTRPIVYTGDEGRQLVYEAGAVFRTANGGGVRVHDPPFVIGKDRLLISVVGLNRPDRQSFSGSTVLIRGRNTGTSVANNSAAGNVDTVAVTLSNTSQYNLWNESFSAQGFTCNTSPDSEEVECKRSSGIDRVYVVYHDIAVDIES